MNWRLIYFRFQSLDFQRQALKFGHLARQKADGKAGLFSNSRGREQVGVSQLVLAFVEALHLNETLAEQGFEAIVGFTQTDSQRIGQIALAQLRVDLKKAQDLEVIFFLKGWKFGSVHLMNADANTACLPIYPAYGELL